MSSPAERYAASRRRPTEHQTSLGRFRSHFPFDLDEFQERACRSLEGGRGVLVAAPTGAGKTVVGEFAVHLALEEGRKCFYTTPIKALSNQKFHDLVAKHGPSSVGLLTGDNTINGEASVVVMTTEVLRNMLYAGSPTLSGLGYVVMDEVHYLADVFRGAVWEEVIINLAESVSVISLSATVSNAEEFGDWLTTVRGETDVVVEERRPVPLWQHVMAGPRLLDLFAQTASADETRRTVNPQLTRYTREQRFAERSNGRRKGRRRGGSRAAASAYTPTRVEVLDRLDKAGLLPAIVFVFSRAGCDAAVQQCLHAGVRLAGTEERAEIRSIVEERCEGIPDDDLRVLGYDAWLDGLERGVAAHHAGMLPTFKEAVEELFVRGLLRAVFATETLALGINMPARTVVLERLVKWNGETHADVTPGEYTQLTGRAGRRGIDVEGHAVVLWQPGFDPMSVAGLASTRTYPLRSSFRPSYNMAVNLVDRVGRATAREILESSFAQFQADRAVVGLARQLRRSEEALEGYHEAMSCHLGDFEEYAKLRQAINDLEKAHDHHRDEELARLSRQMRSHPCHRCPDREDHARWAHRWHRLRRETRQLSSRIESRTNTIARQFDRVCAVLEKLEYLDGDHATEPGRRLARLYGELDLVAAECLREGVWEGLDPAELAACVSALTFESRQSDDRARPAPPSARVRDVLAEMVQLWGELEHVESEHGLDFLREPDLGFASAAWRWASGHRLEAVLSETGQAAGDFVRAVRQLLDLLDQIADAAGSAELRETARLACGSLRRGVVAYDVVIPG